MLAAQLNELGVSYQQPQTQPEQPPRNNRQQSVGAGKPSTGAPSSVSHHQSSAHPVDPVESSDSESETDEPNDRARNDGTLLASDPPKPL